MKSGYPPITILAFVILLPIFSFSQTSYTISYNDSSGNPGGINTGQDFASLGWDPILPSNLSVNQWSPNGSIPFSFSFYNQPVSQFAVTANGVLAFDPMTPPLPNSNGNIPTAALTDNAIACFWENFTINAPTGGNDFVYTQTFGIPPMRQFWIKWSSFELGSADFAYFAIVLEETTNKIYVVDMYSSTNSTSLSTTVGIQADNFTGVQAGNNIPLGALGPANNDNRFYEFTPFTIQPTDLKPVAVLSPNKIGCGLNQEVISFSYTNIGQSPISGMKASFSVDGGPFSQLESISGTIIPADTLTYTFNSLANLSALGNHEIKVAISTNGDGNTNNDTLTFNLENLLHINAFPYQEDFENGQGGWSSGGVNSSWELDTPNNDTIQGAFSGTKAWITNASGNYNDNEQSEVNSPCFDLSSATQDYWVIMNIWWESEYSWDGAVLQSSTDLGDTWSNIGTVGDPFNWYNDSTLNGLPANQLEGWTGQVGTTNGSGDWVEAKHPLDMNLLGQSEVRFRIAFGSDGVQTEDGFAFDDFTIAQAPQVNLGNDGLFCEGTVINAGNSGQTYLWSTGDTTQTITLNNNTGAIIFDSLIIVTVTNSFGLSTTDSIKVTVSIPISISVNQIQNIDCFGDGTGQISTSISGGMPPYTFMWVNGSSTQNLTGLTAGDYSVFVTDSFGCQDSLGPITLIENPEIVINSTQIDITCFGEANGEIDLQIAGGVGSYEFDWSNGDTTIQVSQLNPGNYTVTVSDSLNCSKNQSFTIVEPDSLAISLDNLLDASCFSFSDGSIDINLMGGTSPYMYSWSNGATSQDLQNLATGFYYADIQDSNGCLITTDTFEISFQDSTPVAGFTYQVSGGVVTFTDTSIGANSYFWDFGDATQGSNAANPIHNYGANAVYQVQQIITNACGSDTTIVEIPLETVGIDEWESDYSFHLFPNPTKKDFFIEFSLPYPNDIEIQVFDLNGRPVYQENIAAMSSQFSHSISLGEELAAGIYLVDILVKGKGHFYKRIVKN